MAMNFSWFWCDDYSFLYFEDAIAAAQVKEENHSDSFLHWHLQSHNSLAFYMERKMHIEIKTFITEMF